MSKAEINYIHGFSQKEQERLYKQAKFFEDMVFEKIDFSRIHEKIAFSRIHEKIAFSRIPGIHKKTGFSQAYKVLEVGCGVGAQTEILLRRFPHICVTGVDASTTQITQSKKYLGTYIKQKRVTLDLGNAENLSYPDETFDGAFICWFLEHVKKPVEILKEIRRTLKPSAVIYCTEVLNATFYVHPYSPATLQYWFQFNDHHWSLGGDPFVGAKLANYLLAAGYQNISTEVSVHHYDNRTPKKRAQFIEDWISFLLSGAPNLLKAKKVTPKLVEEMRQELTRLKDDPDAVFFNTWVQAKAHAC